MLLSARPINVAEIITAARARVTVRIFCAIRRGRIKAEAGSMRIVRTNYYADGIIRKLIKADGAPQE